MDSLLLLCARHVVAQRPLPIIYNDLYPILFKAAFLDERLLVLQDLVATWPFPVLHLKQLVGKLELVFDRHCKLCIGAIMQGVMEQLQQELEEPGSDSRCRLRVLDITGVWDLACKGITKVLATACVEVSRLQQEFQRQGIKQHKGCSGVMTAKDALQPPGVDVHADLVVDSSSYGILRDALQTGAASPLHLKFHKFQPEDISASEIVTLLESLDPSCLQRVDLYLKRLRLAELLEILPHLSRFPELCSLNLQDSDLDEPHAAPESPSGIHCMARQLGMLPSLRELNLGSTQLSGKLHEILCHLQAPLERLDLGHCSLVPNDLTFLSQSFHAPALKKLDLSGLNVSQGLLEPLQLLLEKTSSSLLYLYLTDCHIADSHLAVLLPTLLRCSCLRVLGLYGNPLSTDALKDLLQKTLELPDLHEVIYPYPRDCYKPKTLDSNGAFEMDEDHLAAVHDELSKILENAGRTDLEWSHFPITDGFLELFTL